MKKYIALLAIFSLPIFCVGKVLNIEKELGDVAPIDKADVSQNAPYGITRKTPPPIFKISQKPHLSKYRSRVRMYQQVPSIESSSNGRLWAAYMCSNVTVAIDPFHYEQYIIIATSEDGGGIWREVYAIDSSGLANSAVSDSCLWKDTKGNIRLSFIANQNLYNGKKNVVAASWEYTMKDPNSADCGWLSPRLLGNISVAPQKPMNFPDGSILRPVDNFWNHADPNRIRFVKETIDGKVEFVSSLTCVGASWAEHSPYLCKDGSIVTQVRMNKVPQAMFKSTDGGKNWISIGRMNPPIAINTRCCFYRLKSGRLLLLANDFGMLKNEKGEEITPPDWTLRRSKLTAFISEDDGKTFPYKMLLDERRETAYPSVTECSDGFIYVAYDRGRLTPNVQEILFAKFKESDVLAGKPNNKDTHFRGVINRISDFGGGLREYDIKNPPKPSPNW